MKGLIIIIMMITLIPMILAFDFEGTDPSSYGLETPPREVPKNFSVINTNSSNFWITTEGVMNDVSDIEHDWLSDLAWSVAGHIIDTDFDINGYTLKGKWNGTSPDDWIIMDGSGVEFNSSKFNPVYWNATEAEAVVGTIDGGTLVDTQHSDAQYDGTTFNFSEEAGSPGVELYLNFTGLTVDTFNRGIMRYKTSSLKGDFPLVQMWSYTDSAWEDYPYVVESETFATMTQPVFDGASHIQDGVAQMRIYKADSGNTQNHYYIDWIALISGVGLPSGEEVDPDFNKWLHNASLKSNISGNGYSINNLSYSQATTLNITGTSYLEDLIVGGNSYFQNITAKNITSENIITNKISSNDFFYIEVDATLYPLADLTDSLGAPLKQWNAIYGRALFLNNNAVLDGLTNGRITATGNLHIKTDNSKIFLGNELDASIYYNASDMLINPKEVGLGKLYILGDLVSNTTGASFGDNIYMPLGNGTFNNITILNDASVGGDLTTTGDITGGTLFVDATIDHEISTSSNHLYIKNLNENKNIYFTANDDGVQTTFLTIEPQYSQVKIPAGIVEIGKDAEYWGAGLNTNKIYISEANPSIHMRAKQSDDNGIASFFFQYHVLNTDQTTTSPYAEFGILANTGNVGVTPYWTYMFVGSAYDDAALKITNTSVGIGLSGTDTPSSTLDVNGDLTTIGDLSVGTNALNVDSTNGLVAIGDINVAGRQFYVNTPQIDWTTTAYAGFFRVRSTTAGTNSKTINSILADHQIFGSGTHSGNRNGLNAQIYAISDGTINNAVAGRYDVVGHDSAASDGTILVASTLQGRFQPYYQTIVTAYGLRLMQPINFKGSGRIENYFGIWIDDFTDATVQSLGVVIDSDELGLTLGTGQEVTISGSVEGLNITGLSSLPYDETSQYVCAYANGTLFLNETGC